MNEKGREFNITITSGTIIRAILMVVLFVFLYFIRDLVLVVLAAIVIASAVEPLTRRLGLYRIRRLPAVILIYLVLAFLLAGFFIFFLPSLLGDMVTYLNNLPSTIRLSDFWNPVRDSGFLTSAQSVTDISNQSFSIKDMIDGIKSIISGTSAGVLRTASIVFGGLLSFILMIVLSFYLAVQEDGIGNFLRIITPVGKHDYVIGLWKRSQRKIGYWMQGQLLLGVLVGVLVYLGLMVLGVNHALLLACIAAIFEIIPIFGPILSAIPAVLIAVVDGAGSFGGVTSGGGITAGVLVAGLYLIIHQFENHLLYPLVVRKIVGVSPILVILSLVVGFKLAGVLGALLSVPVAAALMEYVSDLEKDRKATKPLPLE